MAQNHRVVRSGIALALVALWLACGAAGARADGVTSAGDDLRTGWYPDQSSLTQDLVTGGTFGQLFSTPVTGQVYAQPLVSNGVLFVATEGDWIYGLDPATGAVKWSRNVGTPWNASDLSCGDLAPTVGVTGTPVIDPSTGTAYFFAKRYASGTSGPAAYEAHAVDVATGQERPNFPVNISGTAQNNPLVSFDPTHELQRPGLLLMDGVVYAAFGGHCDNPPWQGWIVGVSTSGQVKSKWVALDGTKHSGAGIWQSGGGLVSDGPGRIFAATGNGGTPPAPTAGTTPPANLGESLVRLQVQPDESLQAADFFAPYDAATLDTWDADFASGGPVAFPDAHFGTATVPHLITEVGKQGYVYLLDRDHLGGIGEGPDGADAAVQRIGPYGGVWSRPAVWPGDGGYLYEPTASAGTTGGGTTGNLRVYHSGTDAAGKPALSLVGSSHDAFGFSSGAPVVTSDGTTSGSAIVWVIWAPGPSGAGAQLRAYSAVPAAGAPQLLWSAPIGTSTKFTPPGVAGGRIYVGTRDGHLVGFGSPVDPPLTAPSLAFGRTLLGDTSPQQTETITARRPVTVNSIAATSSQFRVGSPSRALPATLASGDSITVPVSFKPATAGPAGGSLQIGTSSTQVNAGMTGVGVSPDPLLEVDPPALTFGGTRVGADATGTFTIANVGGAPMTIDSLAAPGAPFSIEGAPSAGDTVAPGGAITVDIHFNPTTTGSFSDALTVGTNGGSESAGISGSAAAGPRLEIAPTALDFGTVELGSSSTRTFEVGNTGGTFLGITRSKAPAGGVFVATSELPEGTGISPGHWREVTVEFRPTAPGAASDRWELNGDDGDPPRFVTMTGTGAPGAAGTPAAAPVAILPPAPAPALAALRLQRLRVSPRRFAVRRRPHIRVSFSAPGSVVFTVERRVRGRYVRVGSSWRRGARAGVNEFALPLHLGGRTLRRGRYRLTAKPPGGTARHASFRVLAR
jgi:outer membrane protein assembly factor BamB